MTSIRQRSTSETQPLPYRLQAILPSTANMTLTDRQPERHRRRLSVGSYDVRRQHQQQATAVAESFSDRGTTDNNNSSCGIESIDGVADMARRLRFRRYHSQSAFNKWNLSAALSFNVVSSASASPSSSFPVDVIPQMNKKAPSVLLLRSRSLTSCAAITETDSNSSRSGRRSTSLSPQTPPRAVIAGERIHQHQQQSSSGKSSDYMKYKELKNAATSSDINRPADDHSPSTPGSMEKSRESSCHLCHPDCSTAVEVSVVGRRKLTEESADDDLSKTKLRHPDCSSLSDILGQGNRPPSNKSSSDSDEDSSSNQRISCLLSPRRVDKSSWSDRSSLSTGSRYFDKGRDVFQSDRHLLNIDVLRHHLEQQLNASAAAALRSTSPACYDLQYQQLPGCHHLIQSLQPTPFGIGGALGFQFPIAGSRTGVDPLRICLDPESTSRSVFGSCSQLQKLQCGVGVAPESNVCLYFQLYFLNAKNNNRLYLHRECVRARARVCVRARLLFYFFVCSSLVEHSIDREPSIEMMSRVSFGLIQELNFCIGLFMVRDLTGNNLYP
jgi:hypothetical protein